MRNNKPEWHTAADACLATTLARLEELARDCGDIRQLEGIAKTVGEIAAGGAVLNRSEPNTPHVGEDD